jgi:tryptophanyl-tRNA synthetase
LTIFFMNLVSVERLKRNPTIKEEIKLRGFGNSLNAGFLTYPISQAADILLFHAEGVPVGEDQLPMIEQANDIVTTFNYTYHTDYFSPCHAILSEKKRLIGTDGKNKMSKSLKNAIFLCDSQEQLLSQVMSMYTDPNHIKVTDPGKVEGNVVFEYLDIFDKEKEELEDLKLRYEKGGLGDVFLKRRLFTILDSFLEPIRIKYEQFFNNKLFLKEIIKESSRKVKLEAEKNISTIKEIMKINF